jgi:hypothetical protein
LAILPSVQPAVFRGVGLTRGATRIASLVTVYVGGFAVLWGLGLVVRGWQGWALLATPLVFLVASRLWAWRRVGVEVAEGTLRYEGAAPERDFEVEVGRIAAVYFDRALPGAPLVLVLEEGDERVCGELSSEAARALHAHLVRAGVPAVQTARAA